MPGSTNQNRGFTLIEIMVAVSIFALIAAMTTTNLIQVGKTGERVSEVQRRLSEIQFAFAYLGKDITQLVNRKIRDQYGDEQHQLRLTENRLEFTRGGWNNLLQQTRSDLQRVEYRIDDQQLKRRFWVHLDQVYDEDRIEQSLLDGVEDFSVKLLTEGSQDYKSWPPDELESGGGKPVAIEVTMELEDFGQIHRVYELNDAIL